MGVISVVVGQSGVPELVGLPLDSAKVLAQHSGLTVKVIPARDSVHHDYVNASSVLGDTVTVNWKYQSHALPRVEGRSLSDAKNVLQGAGFRVDAGPNEAWAALETARFLRLDVQGEPNGFIKSQDPQPGAIAGLPVLHLVLGGLESYLSGKLPDTSYFGSPANDLAVAGLPLDSAQKIVEDSGYHALVESALGTSDHDVVTAAVRQGDTVVLRWFYQDQTIPNLLGKTLDEARQILREVGFSVDAQPGEGWGALNRRRFLRMELKGDTLRRVTRQSPKPGVSVRGLPKLRLYFARPFPVGILLAIVGGILLLVVVGVLIRRGSGLREERARRAKAIEAEARRIDETAAAQREARHLTHEQVRPSPDAVKPKPPAQAESKPPAPPSSEVQVSPQPDTSAPSVEARLAAAEQHVRELADTLKAAQDGAGQAAADARERVTLLEQRISQLEAKDPEMQLEGLKAQLNQVQAIAQQAIAGAEQTRLRLEEADRMSGARVNADVDGGLVAQARTAAAEAAVAAVDARLEEVDPAHIRNLDQELKRVAGELAQLWEGLPKAVQPQAASVDADQISDLTRRVVELEKRPAPVAGVSSGTSGEVKGEGEQPAKPKEPAKTEADVEQSASSHGVPDVMPQYKAKSWCVWTQNRTRTPPPCAGSFALVPENTGDGIILHKNEKGGLWLVHLGEENAKGLYLFPDLSDVSGTRLDHIRLCFNGVPKDFDPEDQGLEVIDGSRCERFRDGWRLVEPGQVSARWRNR
jgi:hypothetical protein